MEEESHTKAQRHKDIDGKMEEVPRNDTRKRKKNGLMKIGAEPVLDFPLFPPRLGVIPLLSSSSPFSLVTTASPFIFSLIPFTLLPFRINPRNPRTLFCSFSLRASASSA